MSETDPKAALERLAAAPFLAPDPDLREWPAPGGVLATPEGLRSTFRAMGFSCLAEAIPAGVVFQAWRRPRASGALLAVAVSVATFLAATHYGIPLSVIVVAVILESYYLPSAILPGYNVSGRLSAGRLQIRIGGQGLFARPPRLEKRIRFFLEPRAVGDAPSSGHH